MKLNEATSQRIIELCNKSSYTLTKLAELSYNHEMKSKANDYEYVKSNFNDLEREGDKDPYYYYDKI